MIYRNQHLYDFFFFIKPLKNRDAFGNRRIHWLDRSRSGKTMVKRPKTRIRRVHNHQRGNYRVASPTRAPKNHPAASSGGGRQPSREFRPRSTTLFVFTGRARSNALGTMYIPDCTVLFRSSLTIINYFLFNFSPFLAKTIIPLRFIR